MKKNLFVLAALISSSSLFAQQDTTLLDEAVITANRYPGKTALTGKVVTVIPRDQLERSGAKNLSQVLAEQAGIYIGGANSNPGKDKSLYLQGARAEHTLILIDGVPVYDPSGIGGQFDLRNLALNTIERIEILKGSQSTLYGSDAIAGVINIITRKTDGPAQRAFLQAAVGSLGSRETSAGISKKEGIVDFNAAYSFFRTAGINETVSKNPNEVVDRDGFRQNSFQADIGIRPSAKFSFRPFFRYTGIHGGIDQDAFTGELDYTYRQKSRQAGINNELVLGKAKLTLVYQYNSISRHYRDDSTLSRNGFDIYSDARYTGVEHFADAFIYIPLGRTLKFTAGLDYRRSKSDQDYFSVGYFGTFESRNTADSLHQHQWGTYASLNWNQGSGFNLEAGVRNNIHSSYGSHFVYNINPSLLIRQKLKLFVNLSTGYRTPSLYQLFSEYGNRKLKPESSISIDGGLQYYASNKKLTGWLMVFHRAVDKGIFFFYDPNSFRSQYINQDKQRDKGLEAEASYKITKGTSVGFHYAYVTGRVFSRQNGKDSVYFNLLRRPKSSGGVRLSSQVSSRFFFSSNLLFAGERKDAYFDNGSFTTVNVVLGSYFLWDVYAEYGLLRNRLKFFLDGRNISNSRYTEISGFATPGATLYAGLRYRVK